MKFPIQKLLALPVLVIFSTGPMAADEVTKWSEFANRLAFSTNMNPLFHTRLLAMTHAAMHDAINAVERRYQPYSFRSAATPGASAEAAVATAAHAVLSDQLSQLAAFGFPPLQAEVNAAYAASMAAIPSGTAKTLGAGVGQAAASQMLSLRAADGAYLAPLMDRNYVQGTAPGQYRFTPPFAFAFGTKWGSVPPFVLDYPSRFGPNKPYRLGSRQYTADFNEVKALGGDGAGTPSTRTADQTQIALFWLEASPLGWNRIARTVSATAELSLWENARLFALLNMALADGYIGSFEAKYAYNFWRPITAIRAAATDGNDDTTADANWTPLAVTPAIPDHDSAHAVEGSAAAEVLERFFGNARFSFRTCSTSLPAGSTCNDPSPVYRSYSSFTQASLENGLSRIYVGFHFRRAVMEGIEHGRKIGHWAFQRYLRPVE